MKIQVLLPVVLGAALLGSDAYAATGARTCGQAEEARTAWQVLARLDLAQPALADTGSGAQGAAPEALAGNSEVETYVRLHHEAAAGDARIRLTPWPQLRSLAP